MSTSAPPVTPPPARPLFSVVVPSYGCASCLSALYDGLVAALTPISPDFEIVLVEDHSPQGDWPAILGLAARDRRVRGVKLSRNFGQHNAIAAGLAYAGGEWIVVMDCDLQDRPEAIPQLYAKALEGFDCVFARRIDRQDPGVKVALSRLFSRIHGLFAGFKPDAAIGNFSVVSHRVARELRHFRERERNYAIQVHWLGFPTAYVDVSHGARHSGKSTYTLMRQLRHAIATVLTQSTRPLYASAIFGLTMAIGAGAAALYLVGRKLTTGFGVEGWTSVIVSVWFLFGVLFLNLGVIGLYLGSVFLQLKGLPPFVVERTTFEDERDGAHVR
jgi:dolichol-phosphate mannosyltransferase